MYVYTLTAFLWLTIAHAQTTSKISTSLGDITGTIESTDVGTDILVFKGIPYAKAPTGDRRFKLPEAYGSWSGVHDGTEYGAGCYQETTAEITEVSEDCLFLNIILPGGSISGTPKHVMVWVHGGGWVVGASQEYKANNLAAYGDVVIVTINYRLGVLGFMTTGDDVIPGNLGIADAVMALQWVQDNIADYGGDPASVTVFGESAGGWSVSVLSVTPLAAGLFHRAIGQSGTVLYADDRSSMFSQAQTVAKSLGCTDYDTSDQIHDCVSEATAEDLSSLQEFFMVYVDGYVLPKSPHEIWASGDANVEQYMIGLTSYDGSVWLDVFDPTSSFWFDGVNKDMVETLIYGVMEMTPYTIGCEDDAFDFIKRFYFDNNLSRPKKNIDPAVNMFTDSQYLASGMDMTALAIESGHDVYWYYFSEPTAELQEFVDVEIGALHATELSYMFGWELDGGTEKSIRLSKSMMTAWTSFAKSGAPVWLDENNDEQAWPKYSIDDGGYVEFNQTETSVQESHLLKEREDFWLDGMAVCEFNSGSRIVNSATLFMSLISMVIITHN